MPQDWTFLTNHGFVLVALARQPDLRLRDVARIVGITERAAQEIVNDLVDAGYLERAREGRRNRYVVHGEVALRHELTKDHVAADLITAIVTEVRVHPRPEACTAVVLACSDHRFQEGLHQFLASQGLLGQAEVLLWPGGAAALQGPQRREVLAQLSDVTADREPERVLLIAHQDCRAAGILQAKRDDPGTYRALIRSRRLARNRVEHKLGLTPELWFTDRRRTRQLTIAEPSAVLPAAPAVPALAVVPDAREPA